jgi:hypothetical protein
MGSQKVALVLAACLGFTVQTLASADEFNGNSSANNATLGLDPSICKDPQIAKIERETNTTARVFPPGPVSRSWETRGNAQPGACLGSPGNIVEFIPKKLYASVSQDVYKNNGTSGQPGGQSRVPQLDHSIPNPTSGPFRLNAQENAVSRPTGYGESPKFDYNTYNPLSVGIRRDETSGPPLKTLYGKMMIPGQREPVRFTVQPGFQVTYTSPQSMGAITPRANDNFSSARGYMRGPMTLEVRDLKLKSGKYMRPELVQLYYNPPR